MQPFDYSSQLQAPGVLDSYVQGLRVADAREQAALARQQKELEIQQKQAAMDAASQKQQALQGFLAIKDPTGKDYSRLMTLFPEQAEHFQKAWSVLDADQKQAAWSKATQLQAALESGNTDIAKQLADQYAEAAKNAGDSNAAQGYQTISGMIDVSPEKARRFGGAYLMSIDADKGAKVIDQAQKLRLQASEQSEAAGKAAEAVAKGEVAAGTVKTQIDQTVADLEKTGWDTKNLKSQISERAGRLKLDRERLELDRGKIEPDVRKIINESAIAAAAAKQGADQANRLANDLEKIGGGYGAFGSADEFIKKTLGNQDAMTQLRQEYTRVRSTQVSKLLPPGPASDTDVKNAMAGFPPPNADSKQLASFLRGLAKLQDVEAAMSNAKTDWLAKNGGQLTRAKDTFIVGDFATRPGETWLDFSKRVAADVSKSYGPKPLMSDQIPDRPNQPVSGNAAILQQADAILAGGRR